MFSFWFCLPATGNYTLHSPPAVVSLLLSNIRALAYFNLVPPQPVCCFPLAWLCPTLDTVTVSHGYCVFSFVPTPLLPILSSVPHLPLGPCPLYIFLSVSWPLWQPGDTVDLFPQCLTEQNTEEDSSPGACLESHSTWHPLAVCDCHHSPVVQPGEPRHFWILLLCEDPSNHTPTRDCVSMMGRAGGASMCLSFQGVAMSQPRSTV